MFYYNNDRYKKMWNEVFGIHETESKEEVEKEDNEILRLKEYISQLEDKVLYWERKSNDLEQQLTITLRDLDKYKMIESAMTLTDLHRILYTILKSSTEVDELINKAQSFLEFGKIENLEQITESYGIRNKILWLRYKEVNKK